MRPAGRRFIEIMLSWRHSGFNVYCETTIWPNNNQGLEDLARYFIRACFSQERMTYIPAKDTLYDLSAAYAIKV
jgi:hypothetical protein